MKIYFKRLNFLIRLSDFKIKLINNIKQVLYLITQLILKRRLEGLEFLNAEKHAVLCIIQFFIIQDSDSK